MIDRKHEWVCTDCGAKFEKQPSMCNACGAETFALLQKEYDAAGNLEEVAEEAPVEKPKKAKPAKKPKKKATPKKKAAKKA
jgi:predicted  nucleic acid-binding Zn-ribbon protein